MEIVVISPPDEDPREISVLSLLIEAGLGRYHVRKPGWPVARIEAWLKSLPSPVLSRIVLHGSQELSERFGLRGRHWADGPDAPLEPGRDSFSSRSCHAPESVLSAFGRYDSVFFGPVFASLSKPGHGPNAQAAGPLKWPAGLRQGTAILAIGGVRHGNLAQCHAWGYDGAAVIGAVWAEADPVKAFAGLRSEARRLAERRHAA